MKLTGWHLRDEMVNNTIKKDITDSINKCNALEYKHYLILDYPHWDDQEVHLTIYYNVEGDSFHGGYYEVYSASYGDEDESIKELAIELGKEFKIPVYEMERRMMEITNDNESCFCPSCGNKARYEQIEYNKKFVFCSHCDWSGEVLNL